MQYPLNIPFLNSLKFVPVTFTPGIHFDDDWMYNQIKDWARKVNYYQKWQIGDTTIIHIESAIMPANLEIYGCDSTIKKYIPFILKASSTELGINIYEAVVNLDDLPVNNTYYPVVHCSFMSIVYRAVSEPIFLKAVWPGTLLFNYTNSYNTNGVAFYTTGVSFNFRCEAGIMDMQPDYDGTDYVDQIHNVEVLTGTPFRTFKLEVADEKGVAPWVFDLLNRIFSACDYVSIKRDATQDGLQYSKIPGAKWSINRVHGYPLYGGNLEIIESINKSGLQFSTPDGPIPGLVFGYQMNSNFFGTVEDDAYIKEIKQL